MYVDTSGAMVALLQNLDDGPRARAALAPLLVERRYGRGHRPVGPGLTLRRADYDYLTLSAWQDAIENHLVGARGIVVTGIKDSKNRVYIGVSSESGRAEAIEAVRAAGVPPQAVLIEVVEPPRQLYGPAVSLRDTFAAVPGGVRINVRDPVTYVASGCTLAFNLMDAADTTQVYFATNSHCTVEYGALRAGAPREVHQPYDDIANRLNPDRLLGPEVFDPPWDPDAGHYLWQLNSTYDTHCPSGATCRAADIAWGKYTLPTRAAVGRIAKPARLNPMAAPDLTQWDPYGPYHETNPADPTLRINGTAWYALEGESVDKIGATSGWSRGVVTFACGNLWWDTTASPYKIVICTQMTEGGISDGGDSGAPVFRYHGNGTVTLLGILWGGYLGNANWPPAFSFSPWGGVLADLPPTQGFHRICDVSATGSCF